MIWVRLPEGIVQRRSLNRIRRVVGISMAAVTLRIGRGCRIKKSYSLVAHKHGAKFNSPTTSRALDEGLTPNL